MSDPEPHPKCPLCQPRPDESEHWIKVGTLAVATLYLDRNQTYRGHCQLVYDPRHAEGLERLLPDEYTRFMSDLATAARAINAAFQPDLMNYASLGNVVRHVHWHIVPRYRSDPRWGAPIYTTDMNDMKQTRLAEEEYLRIVAAIRGHLDL
jgi:diadenosine tetraphosphate (Ap4A) HIT family hydrolase